MVTPPIPLRPIGARPPAWHRWVLNVLYSLDRRTIDDWVGLMATHLRMRNGSSATQTARYTVDTLHHVNSLRSATRVLAQAGNPVARASFAEAADELESALERLYDARDELLRSIGADHVDEAE